MEGQVIIELLGELPSYLGIGLQTLTALFLGGLIGYDRERKSKAAGLKTHMLICLGACIFTVIGILVSQTYGGTGDPNRIAAQIVSGIGFLGAGAIIRGRQGVVGLTSAATIWLVAAIGYAIGAGYIFSAGAFTVTVFVVLNLISPLYKFLEKEKAYKYYQIEVLSKGSIKRVLRGIILTEEVVIDEIFEEDYDQKKGKIITSAFVQAHMRQIDRIVSSLSGVLQIEKVTHHTVAGRINRIINAYKDDGEFEDDDLL